MKLFLYLFLFFIRISLENNSTQLNIRASLNHPKYYTSITHTQKKYEEKRGNFLFKYSLIAYCPPLKIAYWDCGNLCNSVKKLSNFFYFRNEKNDVFAYIGLLKETNSHILILSIRGSNYNLNQTEIENLSNDSVKYNKDSDCNNCFVQKNIYEKYSSFSETIVNYIKLINETKIMGNFNQTFKFYVTGHGIGGSIAILIGLDLVSQFDFIKSPIIGIYTFGMTRFANKDFMKYIQGKLGFFKPRVTYRKDPSPHYGSNINFVHIPNEIYYNLNKKKYDFCSEDNDEESKNCSNSISKENLNWSDHWSYYSFNGSEGINNCNN